MDLLRLSKDSIEITAILIAAGFIFIFLSFGVRLKEVDAPTRGSPLLRILGGLLCILAVAFYIVPRVAPPAALAPTPTLGAPVGAVTDAPTDTAMPSPTGTATSAPSSTPSTLTPPLTSTVATTSTTAVTLPSTTTPVPTGTAGVSATAPSTPTPAPIPITPTITLTITLTPTPITTATNAYTPTALASACSDTIRSVIQRASASQAAYMVRRDVTTTRQLADAWGDATGIALSRANTLTQTNASIKTMTLTNVVFAVTDCSTTSQPDATQITVHTQEQWSYMADLTCRQPGAAHTSLRIDEYPAEEYVLVGGETNGWRIKDWRLGKINTVSAWDCVLTPPPA